MCVLLVGCFFGGVVFIYHNSQIGLGCLVCFFVCVFNRPLGNTSQQKTRPQIASLACFCDTRTLLKTTLSIHAGAVWQQVVSHSAAKNCILWSSFRSMLPPLLFSVVACDTRVDTPTSSPDR